MMLVGHAESQSPCGLFLTAWHLPTCCCLAGAWHQQAHGAPACVLWPCCGLVADEAPGAHCAVPGPCRCKGPAINNQIFGLFGLAGSRPHCSQDGRAAHQTLQAVCKARHCSLQNAGMTETHLKSAMLKLCGQDLLPADFAALAFCR